MMVYDDILREGDLRRIAYRDGIHAFLRRKEQEGRKVREEFMPVEGFAGNLEFYRRKYVTMLGLDKLESFDLPAPKIEPLGEDADAVIYRTELFITPEIPQYGLLFVPHGTTRAPLVIAQHGGGGTPELCSDLNGKNNYNHLVRRLLQRNAVVFAPQLLLWNFKEALPTMPTHDIPYHRHDIDKGLRRFGLSLTALEIKGIQNAINFLTTLPFVEERHIGMAGLSYGGYYTLYTMAAEPRILAGFSNACFNDRNAYPWYDWVYPNSANTFHDAEVAALCAPRKLYIAVGKEDQVFDFHSAIPEAQRVKKYFAAAGCPDNFVFSVWEGGHTVPDTDEGFDFLFSAFQS